MQSIIHWLLGSSDFAWVEQVSVQALHSLTGLMLAWFHGVHKLLDGLAWKSGKRPNWPFRDEIEEAGFPFPLPNAYVATAAQLGGGLCLALGVLTRPAALVLSGTLLGAVYTTIVLKKDSQMALVYLLLVLAVLGLGPGAWSVDALLFR
jgi:putative oxidoreductase